jgi:hypothetical protein
MAEISPTLQNSVLAGGEKDSWRSAESKSNN